MTQEDLFSAVPPKVMKKKGPKMAPRIDSEACLPPVRSKQAALAPKEGTEALKIDSPKVPYIGLEGPWEKALSLAKELMCLSDTLRLHGKQDSYLMFRCEVMTNYFERMIKSDRKHKHDIEIQEEEETSGPDGSCH